MIIKNAIFLSLVSVVMSALISALTSATSGSFMGSLITTASADTKKKPSVASPSEETVSLHAYYLKESGSDERIPAWTVLLNETCEWTLLQGIKKSVLTDKITSCADLKKLRDGLRTEFAKPSQPAEALKSPGSLGSPGSMLNYEMEFHGVKRPVFFQPPRRCKIDAQGNEIDCVDFQLSYAQKLLNIMRLKAPKSRHY